MNSKWISTICFFMAAILLSSNIEISKYGFILFFIGHLVLSVLFFTTKDFPMFIQNFGFLFVDLYGIYNWWLS